MNTWAMPPAVTIRLRLCGTTRRIAIARRPSRVGRRAGRETGSAGPGFGELMLEPSLRLDIRPSRNLRKRRHVVADQLVEPFRRGRLRLQADRDPALSDFGLGEDAHDLAVELRDDSPRDGGRGEEAEPQYRLVARHAGLRD